MSGDRIGEFIEAQKALGKRFHDVGFFVAFVEARETGLAQAGTYSNMDAEMIRDLLDSIAIGNSLSKEALDPCPMVNDRGLQCAKPCGHTGEHKAVIEIARGGS